MLLITWCLIISWRHGGEDLPQKEEIEWKVNFFFVSTFLVWILMTTIFIAFNLGRCLGKPCYVTVSLKSLRTHNWLNSISLLCSSSQFWKYKYIPANVERDGYCDLARRRKWRNRDLGPGNLEPGPGSHFLFTGSRVPGPPSLYDALQLLKLLYAKIFIALNKVLCNPPHYSTSNRPFRSVFGISLNGTWNNM